MLGELLGDTDGRADMLADTLALGVVDGEAPKDSDAVGENDVLLVGDFDPMEVPLGVEDNDVELVTKKPAALRAQVRVMLTDGLDVTVVVRVLLSDADDDCNCDGDSLSDGDPELEAVTLATSDSDGEAVPVAVIDDVELKLTLALALSDGLTLVVSLTDAVTAGTAAEAAGDDVVDGDGGNDSDPEEESVGDVAALLESEGDTESE